MPNVQKQQIIWQELPRIIKTFYFSFMFMLFIILFVIFSKFSLSCGVKTDKFCFIFFTFSSMAFFKRSNPFWVSAISTSLLSFSSAFLKTNPDLTSLLIRLVAEGSSIEQF